VLTQPGRHDVIHGVHLGEAWLGEAHLRPWNRKRKGDQSERVESYRIRKGERMERTLRLGDPKKVWTFNTANDTFPQTDFQGTVFVLQD
jgi:hypothetical protein